MVIPDSVIELGEKCFYQCKNLRRVEFGVSPSLKKIGDLCFAGSCLQSFNIPASVVDVGRGILNECPINDENFTCDSGAFVARGFLQLSKDSRVCYGAICSVSEIIIPDCVVVLNVKCFYGCSSLQRVTFNASSNLKFIYEDVEYNSIQELENDLSIRRTVKHSICFDKAMISTPQMRQDCSPGRCIVCAVFGILNDEFSKFFGVLLKTFITRKASDYIRNYTFRQS